MKGQQQGELGCFVHNCGNVEMPFCKDRPLSRTEFRNNVKQEEN